MTPVDNEELTDFRLDSIEKALDKHDTRIGEAHRKLDKKLSRTFALAILGTIIAIVIGSATFSYTILDRFKDQLTQIEKQTAVLTEKCKTAEAERHRLEAERKAADTILHQRISKAAMDEPQ